MFIMELEMHTTSYGRPVCEYSYARGIVQCLSLVVRYGLWYGC
jgi:hypothetical protein